MVFSKFCFLGFLSIERSGESISFVDDFLWTLFTGLLIRVEDCIDSIFVLLVWGVSPLASCFDSSSSLRSVMFTHGWFCVEFRNVFSRLVSSRLI